MKYNSSTRILMVRPAAFGFNEETAANNFYQKRLDARQEEVIRLAQSEFDAAVNQLRKLGIQVEVVEDTLSPVKTDAVFPNNWVSFHEDKAVLYPMYSTVRRRERRMDILDQLGYKEVLHLEGFEAKEQYLEGTGSLVLDRVHQVAYACLSDRTHRAVLDAWAKEMDYELVVFEAYQKVGDSYALIYHTNVMMCVGTSFAVVCLESIRDAQEREKVKRKLQESGKQIIDISETQKNAFAGNMLEVRNTKGETFVVMSASALQALNAEQIKQITQYAQPVALDIPTIETIGGGSARCMIAELY